jgi:1,4-dihydroxy-2-naphthoate octaprenyltransferase
MTETSAKPSKARIWLREVRAPFFTASVAPVIVGSAAGFSVSGEFQIGLFALALAGTVLLHAGANVANDYFDHVSGNDAANRHLTPFSGGSRVIQEGLLRPREVLVGSWLMLLAGMIVGLVVAILTQSLFILALGAAGLLGGYFYTASPVKFGYRGAGELMFVLLFGLLPVCGSYALQAHGAVDAWALLPGALVGVPVALVLLVNEFPDMEADAAAGKRTLVVRLGREGAARLYFALLGATYVAAALGVLLINEMRFGGILFLATLPLAILTVRFAAVEMAAPTDRHVANLLTIVLHVVTAVSLAAGFVISGFKH